MCVALSVLLLCMCNRTALHTGCVMPVYLCRRRDGSKDDSQVSFPFELNTNDYSAEGMTSHPLYPLKQTETADEAPVNRADCDYVLGAVIAHKDESVTVSGAVPHYIAYVCVDRSTQPGRWLCFDDERVTEVADPQETIYRLFGGVRGGWNATGLWYYCQGDNTSHVLDLERRATEARALALAATRPAAAAAAPEAGSSESTDTVVSAESDAAGESGVMGAPAMADATGLFVPATTAAPAAADSMTGAPSVSAPQGSPGASGSGAGAPSADPPAPTALATPDASGGPAGSSCGP